MTLTFIDLAMKIKSQSIQCFLKSVVEPRNKSLCSKNNKEASFDNILKKKFKTIIFFELCLQKDFPEAYGVNNWQLTLNTSADVRTVRFNLVFF